VAAGTRAEHRVNRAWQAADDSALMSHYIS
jgi:hypothetical protein